MTEREAAQAAFKFTSQRLPAVPTDTTAPLNLQSQARSQALINNAFSSEQNNAVTNSAVSAAQNNAVTNSAVSATQNNAATVTNSATSTKAIAAQPKIMTSEKPQTMHLNLLSKATRQHINRQHSTVKFTVASAQPSINKQRVPYSKQRRAVKSRAKRGSVQTKSTKVGLPAKPELTTATAQITTVKAIIASACISTT